MRFVIARLVALCALQAVVVPVALTQSSNEPEAQRLLPSSEAGPQLSLASGLFLPPEGGRLGFAIAGDARYGVAVGKATVAPGVRLAGFFRSGLRSVASLATTRLSARVELPVGTASPYLLGGLGFGHLSEGSHEGFAYQVGGGVTIALSTRLAIGAEVTYLAITGSAFRALFLGPCLTLTLGAS